MGDSALFMLDLTNSITGIHSNFWLRGNLLIVMMIIIIIIIAIGVLLLR